MKAGPTILFVNLKYSNEVFVVMLKVLPGNCMSFNLIFSYIPESFFAFPTNTSF